MTTHFEFRIQNTSTVVFPIKVTSGNPPRSGWVPRPKNFITGNFGVSRNVPFGVGPFRPVPTTLNIHPCHLLAANMLAGYGRTQSWIGTLFNNASDAADLKRFLMHRFDLLSSCLNFSGGSVRIKAFHSKLEPSDKNDLSFMIGTMGTYLAAKQWLRAGDRHIAAFLHTSIYTDALAVPPNALVNLVKNGKKMPDFLVKDSTGEWHVYESKGGVKTQRWSRLLEGLIQLDGVTAVGNLLPAGPLPAPSSKVCVHTVVESMQAIEIIAVDPPSDPHEPKADAPSPKSEPFSLPLAVGVGELSAILDSIKWFESFSGHVVDRVSGIFGSVNVPISLKVAPNGISAGLATPLLKLANLIDIRLAFYQLGRYYFGDENEQKSDDLFKIYLHDNILAISEIQAFPQKLVNSQLKNILGNISQRLFAPRRNRNIHDVWSRALGIPAMVRNCQRWITPMTRLDSNTTVDLAIVLNENRPMTGICLPTGLYLAMPSGSPD